MPASLLFLLTAFVISCSKQKDVEQFPNFANELTGLGLMGTHIDSLGFYWNNYPKINSEFSPKDRFFPEFTKDTFTAVKLWFVHNFLTYPNQTYFNDSTPSHWKISKNKDLYQFDRIGFDSILPDRFFVKMYRKSIPDGLQFFDFDGWDIAKYYHFQMDSTGRARLLFQSRKTPPGPTLCMRFSWSKQEQLYLNSFMNAFVDKRLDTFSLEVSHGSNTARLLFDDSLYHYDAPFVNHVLLYYFIDFLQSRQRWYHFHEIEIKREKFKSPIFRDFPVVIEWKFDFPNI